MRTTKERILHAIAFEVIGLVLIIGILSQLGFAIGHVGALGIFFSIVATGWNYIYNIGFDHVLMLRYHSIYKNPVTRVLHAIGFELGLLVITLPCIAWFMDISLWSAFLLDIGLVIFYLFYAYIYNLAYDKLFPVVKTKSKQ